MSTPLRLRAAFGPQAGSAVALRFNSAGVLPVIPPGAGLRLVASAGWQRAAALAPGAVEAPWQAASPQRGAFVVPWQSTARLGPASVSAGWATLASLLAPPVRAPWGSAVALQAPPVRAAWQGGQPAQVWAGLLWHGAAPLAASARVAWHGGQPAGRTVGTPWRGGLAGRAGVLTPWRDGLAAVVGLLAPWQAGQPLVSYGGPWVPYAPPVPPGHVCYVPPAGAAVALRFGLFLPASLGLRFICLDQRHPVVVPVRRVYMVTNTTALTRVSDGANVPCLGMSLSLDSDSWAWGFSATLPAAALSMIEPDASGEPIELDAEINGQHIRVIAESVSRERVFGQAGVRVQGRGKTAVLDAPYSALTTLNNASAALTTQQLLGQALPSGWTADYGLIPWLVPAGAWSHQGTVMSAALAIAAAGGGYVQPHMTADSIKVLPRYPVAPWGWAGVTPDYELPSAVMTREAIEWSTKPVYNRVYVSGTTNGGKLVRVTRAGSAGDLLARLVADPLITHADGGRQHGLAILADVGVQAKVTLRLPVLPATGLIVPGKFVRYVDGGVTRLGLTRSISVEVALAQVWQTIGAETHVL